MSLGDLFTSSHYRKRPSIVTTPDDARSFSYLIITPSLKYCFILCFSASVHGMPSKIAFSACVNPTHCPIVIATLLGSPFSILYRVENDDTGRVTIK